MAGMATVTIHAPSRNLVNTMTSVTSAVDTAPRAFRLIERSSAPRLAALRRRRHQRRTMPAWESVKAVNTPSR